jgi:hypothetical protein
MPIPTPQPDGDNHTLALPTRMAAAVDEMSYDFELESSADDDEVWVLSISSNSTTAEQLSVALRRRACGRAPVCGPQPGVPGHRRWQMLRRSGRLP